MVGRNAIVLWQAAQSLVLETCVAVLGVALNCEPPIWHVPQLRGVPLKIAFRWQDSQGRSRCTPSSSKPVVRWSKGTVIGAAACVAAPCNGAIRIKAIAKPNHLAVRRGRMSLLSPRAFPGIGRMTAIALGAVLT